MVGGRTFHDGRMHVSEKTLANKQTFNLANKLFFSTTVSEGSTKGNLAWSARAK